MFFFVLILILALVNDNDPGPSRLARAFCNLLNYNLLKILIIIIYFLNWIKSSFHLHYLLLNNPVNISLQKLCRLNALNYFFWMF